jgi:hypothetical protein
MKKVKATVLVVGDFHTPFDLDKYLDKRIVINLRKEEI